MNFLKKLTLQIIALINRYPWAVALFGFVSGIASFLLVERSQQLAQFIAFFMLVSWIWLTLENLLARGVSHWFGFTLPPPLLSFATQLVHQESLFFVIPFFVVTTAWNSGQAIFTSLLIIAAVISIIDPIYYRWLAPRRWLYFIFHGVTLFAVLLTALPILFQLPTAKSYSWALGIAVVLTFPSAARGLPLAWWKRGLAMACLAMAAISIGLWTRAWIPPASLWLTQVAVTDRLDSENRTPENSLAIMTSEQLRTGLYAYTAIHAPRGLNERIYHIWRRNGHEVDRIALDIRGGREAGYRAWSHKLNFPPSPSGKWQIHVITEAGQLIGILRFHVIDAADEVVVTVGNAVTQPSPNEKNMLEIIAEKVTASAASSTADGNEVDVNNTMVVTKADVNDAKVQSANSATEDNSVDQASLPKDIDRDNADDLQ